MPLHFYRHRVVDHLGDLVDLLFGQAHEVADRLGGAGAGDAVVVGLFGGLQAGEADGDGGAVGRAGLHVGDAQGAEHPAGGGEVDGLPAAGLFW